MLDLRRCDKRFVVEWPVQGGAVLSHTAEHPHDDTNTLLISDIFWLPLCEAADRRVRVRGGDGSPFRRDHPDASERPFGPWPYAATDFVPFSEIAVADLPPVDTTRLKMTQHGVPPRLADVAQAVVDFVARAPSETIWMQAL
jgi:hypothetical protein